MDTDMDTVVKAYIVGHTLFFKFLIIKIGEII